MIDPVYDFWEEQAKTHGASDLATAPDHHYRELEIRAIIDHLCDAEQVLDVGCGNGYSTFKFAERFPESQFLGIDYSSEMINAALRNPSNSFNTEFEVFDIRGKIPAITRWNTIISERCLINLANWEEQKSAILRMKRVLADKGRLILVENTKDGLRMLNSLRGQFQLPAINVRWHNCYFERNLLEQFLEEHFTIEYKENIGNLYYILSRVVYAALCHESGDEPSYDADINRIASQLPSLGTSEYSPNWLWVLRKK